MGTDVDVAVVGCGPVGGVLAAWLGRLGRSVVVLERHPAPYPLPRAVHFDHEVGRILQACGLGDDLPRISEAARIYEWRNGSGQTLLRFGREADGPSGWPDSSMFCQPDLERLIEAAAAEQPTVEVRRDRRVTGLVDGGTRGVDLTMVDGEGAVESLRARYVVGCDGANSTVRELLGVAVTDLGFCFDWLIVDVVLHEPRTFDPLNLQICEPSRPTTAVSGGPGRRRWEFMRLPHETVEELDDVARAWELLAPWGVTPGDAVLERHAVYRFQARWADRWRVGNVVLAGDAAHLMPPFAGQGMCSGIRDAANLAWKIDLVLDGKAPEALLDAYEVERADNVRAVIDFSISLGEVICITDPVAAAERDAAMTAGRAGAATQPAPPLPGVTGGIVRSGDPLAGQLFVQGRLAVAGGARRFDDVVGVGWRLVAPDGHQAGIDRLDAGDRAWLESVGGAVVVVAADVDIDGTYRDWFARHGVAAVVQRPDFHLFGAATDADDLTALMAELRSAIDGHPSDNPTEDPP